MSAGGHPSAQPHPMRPAMDGRERERRYLPLFWRVLAVNAVLVLGMGVVTFAVLPDRFAKLAPAEVAVLAIALLATLTANTILLRRALLPLRQLALLMSRVDPLRHGVRATVPSAPSEVADLAVAYNEMLDDLESERRESTSRALAAQESERLRVAQELHDEVGQTLTAVLLGLAGLERDAPEGLHPQIAATTETARESLEAIRRISQRLRPEALDDLGLPGAIAVLCERIGQAAGIGVEPAIEQRLPALPAETELVIYRVAQEALTNAVRHSGARHASLSLRRTGAGVVLTVSDDGRGIQTAERRRNGGLQGMQERADLIHARLELVSRPGTTIRLAVPA